MSRISTISLPAFPPTPRRPHVYDRSTKADSEHSKNVIRASIKPWQCYWGFTILRCTYESDAEWDAFLTTFRNDLDCDLRFETDTDLRASLRLPIVEDKDLLDGATWIQARDFFNEALQQDSKKRNGDSGHLPDPHSTIGRANHERPQCEFFIYVDQASVLSVIGCDESKEAKMDDGSYYFTLVSRENIQPRPEDLASEPEYDSPDSEFHTMTRQRFKIYDFVNLYAKFIDGCWPDFVVEEDGISW